MVAALLREGAKKKVDGQVELASFALPWKKSQRSMENRDIRVRRDDVDVVRFDAPRRLALE